MMDQNSLGPSGPNVISIEAVNDTEYSVQGHNFVSGFRVQVQDGIAQEVQGVLLSRVTSTAFTLTLPYSTPGPYKLSVINPDGRTSTQNFATPGTSASNSSLRANS